MEHTPDKMRSQVRVRTQKNIPRLVLASGSPRREEMLRELGISFKKAPVQVEEDWKSREDPCAIAIKLAARKVQASPAPMDLTVGMDTMVVLGRRILGKPNTAAEAATMLESLSGRMHRVITGVAMRFHDSILRDAETTRVYFRKIRRSEIEWYIKTGEPFDKAGAYGIQGGARLFVRKIEGCFFNVVGFPVDCFQRMLAHFGFTVYDFME
jgi:septum formation protein